MKIGPHEIGQGHPAFICAEIGINHNGQVEEAKRLVDVAVLSGCNGVKFQKRTINIVYGQSELDKPRESPFGTTVRHQKEGLELGQKAYEEIDSHCKAKKIIWFASPWDCPSVDFLEQFDVPCHKVASACITDKDLLYSIAATKKPVILSTGMSSQTHITTAMQIVGPNALPVATTSTYPCKLEDLNLLKIHTLANLFGWPVGYSGHEVGLWTTLCAVALGASYVERHITLDRSAYGSDQSASVEPGGLIKLVREIRDFEKAKGSGRLEILNSEIPILEKLRRFK